MTLSVKAEDTAPVPAKMSAMDVMSGHSSLTTPVINGNNLYLLPKYLLLLINDVLYSLDIVDRPVKEIDAGNYVHDSVDAVYIYDSEQYDVSNQFSIHIHPGTLLIKKRDLVLKSNSATKEYDGTPLKDNAIQFLGSGLAEEDWISAFANGCQQYVGKSRNKISYYFVGGLEKNYSITLDEGTLEITNRKEKLPAIKCPVCKKILFSVPNKQMRNAMLAYDLQNELLSSFCPSYIHRCPRCHNMVGILYLTRDIRKRLNITIAAAYLQLSDEQVFQR